MDHRYISICGMTEKELLTNFKEGINELAEANGDTEEATIAKLKARYDGYHFEENTVGIYNPFSVLNTLSRLRYKDYWFATGTPTFLVYLLLFLFFFLSFLFPILKSLVVFMTVVCSL